MSFKLPLRSPSVTPQLHFLWFISSPFLRVHNTLQREELIRCFFAASFQMAKGPYTVPFCLLFLTLNSGLCFLCVASLCRRGCLCVTLLCHRGCVRVVAPQRISSHCVIAPQKMSSRHCPAEDVFASRRCPREDARVDSPGPHHSVSCRSATILGQGAFLFCGHSLCQCPNPLQTSALIDFYAPFIVIPPSLPP